MSRRPDEQVELEPLNRPQNEQDGLSQGDSDSDSEDTFVVENGDRTLSGARWREYTEGYSQHLWSKIKDIVIEASPSGLKRQFRWLIRQ
jgi:hypothetical protein